MKWLTFLNMEGKKMRENIPIPSGYDVYWEKWVDAYSREMETDAINIVEEFSEEDHGVSFEEELGEEFKKFKNIQTIFTPFGILPLTEHSLASTYFKFWVGHTNFKITPAFYRIISNVDGVESIDVFTPYRFRIGIATLFKDRTVMTQIRQKTIDYIKVTKNAPSQKTNDNRGA